MNFTLSVFQYQLVTASMAGALAIMLGSAVYFLMVRESLTMTNRRPVVLGAVVSGIAGFHYLRLLASWTSAFTFKNGAYVGIGTPFFHGYRYADWIITVPILVVQLVLVLNLDAKVQRSMALRLGAAAALMVALGFPGEVATDTTKKMIFWGLGFIPFAYLVYTLWVEMGQSLRRQPEEVASTVSNARLTLVTTWMFYPIVFLFPVLGLTSAMGESMRQVGYSIADVLAKPGYGLLILAVATLKSKAERAAELEATDEVGVPILPSMPAMPLMPAMPAASIAAQPVFQPAAGVPVSQTLTMPPLTPRDMPRPNAPQGTQPPSSQRLY
jgi:bacteriorhodopsin